MMVWALVYMFYHDTSQRLVQAVRSAGRRLLFQRCVLFQDQIQERCSARAPIGFQHLQSVFQSLKAVYGVLDTLARMMAFSVDRWDRLFRCQTIRPGDVPPGLKIHTPD